MLRRQRGDAAGAESEAPCHVTGNMFGDILSDGRRCWRADRDAAVGTLDANAGDLRADSRFRARYRQEARRNPLATILSLAMMFRYTFNDGEEPPPTRCQSSGAGHADRRHRTARRARDRHARDGRRGRGSAVTDMGASGHPIVVRRAELSDAEAIHSTFAGPKVIAGTLQVPYPSVEMWRKRLTDLSPSDFLLVATIDGDVVGNLGLHEAGKSPRRHCRRQHRMCVRGTRQSEAGGGYRADEARRSTCPTTGSIHQRLEPQRLHDNLAALALYRKFGFVIEGTYRAQVPFAMAQYVDSIRDGSPASGVRPPAPQ
jgi:putative acetyltransferase